MTEVEKMMRGELYDYSDPEALELNLQAHERLEKLNAARYRDTQSYRAALRELIPGFPDSSYLITPFHCDFGTQIAIGDHFVGNYNLTILDEAPVTIGNHVFIGPNVGLYTVTHALDAGQRNAGIMRSRPITIGDDVWIGGNTVVMQGVRIGSGSVIGAGSVVTHDIPAGVIAFGNPCRVVRPITAADRIETVL